MMNVKQVIVMRTDLNMRKGKMAAQAAHASLAVILNMMKNKTLYIADFPIFDVYDKVLTVYNPSALHMWLTSSFTKVCVGVDSEKKLLELYHSVKEADIPVVLITDNGTTEFHGNKTNTCICIGPDFNSVIDPFTKELQLL